MVTKKSTKKTAKKAAKKKTARKKKPTAAQRKKARVANVEFATDRLAAQLCEKLIDELRDMAEPWSKTSEAEQSIIIARISDSVRRYVKEAALTMAAQGHKGVICNLFSVTFKDGVRAIITMPPGSDMRHELADRATQDVVLVFADPDQFMEGLGDLEPDKDQPDLL